MAHPRVSQKRARAIGSSLFLICLAVVAFTGNWWPGLILAVGIPLAVRQFLLGKVYDMCLSLVLFVGAFIASGYNISWEILLPVIFITGAIYTLIREFFDTEIPEEPEEEESLNKEIEEHEK